MIEDESKNVVNAITYLEREIGKEYIGKPEIVQFANFGIPQRRTRAILIYSRDQKLKSYFQQTNSYLPEITHSNYPKKGQKPWVTVRDIISSLPPLDGKNTITASSSIPFHRVPVLDAKKYVWIFNTPPEKSAFDNQCIDLSCGYQRNKIHGSIKDSNGVNRNQKDTPLYCEKCGSLLPRPYTISPDNSKRIMSGYTSAYKRMRWDLPAPTLTTNLSYPSSDHKLHPEQNRVLSLYEAFLLHTLDQFDYKWTDKNNKVVPDTLITESIGESIPPLFTYKLIDHLLKIQHSTTKHPKNLQLALNY